MKSKYHPLNLPIYASFLFVLYTGSGCKKLVQIDPPTSSITTTETFHNYADANAAITGIYASMINTGNPLFGSGAISIDCGLSADELISFQPSSDFESLYLNTIVADNGETYSDLWAKAYPIIYQANACIEGIQASSGLSQANKNQLLGEAKFIRALSYFYLINLFGDVPYVTTTSWAQSAAAFRTPKQQIYQDIVSDLKFAQASLASDYSVSGGERTRANQFAATALLARVYLYMGQYSAAEAQAVTIISNTNTFSLVPDLNGVFLKNNNEAIFQLGINPPSSPIGILTPEGNAIVPPDAFSQPYYYLSPQLLNDFETGDQRKVKWVDSTTYSGSVYYYPYKYKLGAGQFSTGSPTEYYMVLRLGEQYLIKAEAEAQLGESGPAITDLNIIRNRAGLPNYTGATDRTSLLNTIYHERRIELFCEWGHRWLDLKRANQVDAVMSTVTPQKNGGGAWKSYQQLYPIPYFEMSLDPNLTQNAGY